MRPRFLCVAALGAVVALAGCGGGPQALPPLRDTPTTARALLGVAAPTTAAPGSPSGDASLAVLRAELARLVAVPDPAGYRLDDAGTDRDPDTLDADLSEQFSGAGFVHGLVRTWLDAGGRWVFLGVYAFDDPAGALEAWSCGCPGPPLPGVANSSVVTFDDGGVGAAAAVGRYVIRSNTDVPGWLGGTRTVETLLLEARARILAGPGGGADRSS